MTDASFEFSALGQQAETLLKSDQTYFETSIAHYLIISTALFSIVWGLFNVLLVSTFRNISHNSLKPPQIQKRLSNRYFYEIQVKGVDMDDVKPIQNACDAAEALKKDVEYNINEGTE